MPDSFVEGLQALVSLRRIELYLSIPEVDTIEIHDKTVLDSLAAAPILTADAEDTTIAFHNVTVTWPIINSPNCSSGYSTPGSSRFTLENISLNFPKHKLSLVSGSLGSGKVSLHLKVIILTCLILV
jgi:ABC-type multidrug transport system fused ATPase/permease subunit